MAEEATMYSYWDDIYLWSTKLCLNWGCSATWTVMSIVTEHICWNVAWWHNSEVDVNLWWVNPADLHQPFNPSSFVAQNMQCFFLPFLRHFQVLTMFDLSSINFTHNLFHTFITGLLHSFLVDLYFIFYHMA